MTAVKTALRAKSPEISGGLLTFFVDDLMLQEINRNMEKIGEWLQKHPQVSCVLFSLESQNLM